jgi:hypothetical protein
MFGSFVHNSQSLQPEKVGQFQYLWALGAQMKDMEEAVSLKCCHSFGRVHLCAAASTPLLLFTLELKAVCFEVRLRVMFKRLINIREVHILSGAETADCR